MTFTMRVFVGQRLAKSLAARLTKDRRFTGVSIDFQHVHFSAHTEWKNDFDIMNNVSDVFGYRVATEDFSEISHTD